MSKIYTSTALKRYNRCPRYYFYEHELMLDKYAAPLFYKDSDALMLGRALHEGFEAIYTGEDYHEIIENSDYDSEIKNHALTLLEGRINAETFGNIPELDEILAVEKEMSMEYNGRIIAGKPDAIVRYRDELWIIDHKSSRFQLKSEAKYANALQSNLYVRMARKAGYDVRGILINSIRTISLRKKKDESDDDFWERAKKDVIDRSESYFQLIEIPREEREVVQIVDDAIRTIEHIEFDKFNNSYRRNPDACNEYRRLCEFNEICAGRFKESEIARKKVEHGELDKEFVKNLKRESARHEPF